jgi:hypothetical protein
MRSTTTLLAVIALATGCKQPENEPVVQDDCPVFGVEDAAVNLSSSGEAVSHTVTVSNVCASGADLVVTAMVEGAAFALTNPNLTIPAGGDAEVVVTWAGDADDVGTLTLSSNDEARPHARITLNVDFTQPGDDLDGDGHTSMASGGDDCDDSAESVFPGAFEEDDGVDQDCDGMVDEDYVYPGDVWFTEIGVGASGWVELTNVSDRTVVLAGFRIGAAAGEVVLTSEVLAPGAIAVVTPGFALGATDTVALMKEGDYRITTASWMDADEGDVLGLDGSSSDPLNPSSWCEMEATPGEPNGWCEGIDHDGDGYTEGEGDCDDWNAEVGPGAPEVWDGWDNDCNGTADEAAANDVADGWLQGAGSEYLGQLGAGDVDHDGRIEVLVGSPQTGKVYLLEGADHAAWAGSIDGYAEYVVEGSSYWFGETSPRLADNLGGGGDDLVLSSQEKVTVYEGPITGDLTEADADVTISGYNGEDWYVQIASDVDVNGDGVAEILTGAEYVPYVTTNDGVVTIHDVSGGGAYTFSGADTRITTEEERSLGTAITGGDLDGDGYGDVIFGAKDDRESGIWAGALYVVRGGETLPSSGDVESVYDIKILGDASRYERLGSAAPVVDDVDGDGANDLVVSSISRLYTFLDGSTLADGTHDYRDADANLEGSMYTKQWGGAIASADLDGDGVNDEMVTYAYDNGLSDGSVNLYTNGWLLASSWDDYGGRILEEAVSSDIGDNIVAADLDGDGDDEFVVSAPMQAGLVDGSWARTGKLFSFDL